MVDFIIGAILGYIAGTLIGKTDDAPAKSEEVISFDKSISICEELIYSEPFISVRQEKALRNLIDYCKEQRAKEDDCK